MSEDSFEIYVQDAIRRINSTNEPDFYKTYQIAEVYSSCGQYPEALNHYESCVEQLRMVKNDQIWHRVYLTALGQFASTLDYVGAVDVAGQIYEEILAEDPHSFFIGDYAIFLHRRKRNFDLAEKYYQLSLKLYPNQSSMHLKYAGFLRHVRRNHDQALHHYRRAVEVNDSNADAIGGYASFLHGTKGDKVLVESLYDRAIAVDDVHVNNLCNFGLFLSEEKQSFERAESMYKRSLEVMPRHANTLYNYAVMLDSHCNRKPEAEQLYRRCLDVEPRHSFALYNIAVLLEEKNADVDEVRQYFERAVEADPTDTAALADCGRYLITKFKRYDEGNKYLQEALKIDPYCENALHHAGLVALRHKKDASGAATIYRKLLAKNPCHTAGLQQYGRVLMELHLQSISSSGSSKSGKTSPRRGSSSAQYNNLEDAMSSFEKLITLTREPSSVMSEYLGYVTNYGHNKHKLRALSFLQNCLSSPGCGTDEIQKMMDVLRGEASM